MKYSVEAFMDNDPNKWNKTLDGITILNPKGIDNRDREARYIVANNLHSHEIKAQLIQCEVPEDHICVW